MWGWRYSTAGRAFAFYVANHGSIPGPQSLPEVILVESGETSEGSVAQKKNAMNIKERSNLELSPLKPITKKIIFN